MCRLFTLTLGFAVGCLTGCSGLLLGGAPGSTPDGGPGPPDGGEIEWSTGDPGCGLPSAAFCDTFDAPSPSPTGRAYELDSGRWALSRMEPTLGALIEIGPATVASCRADVPGQVVPPGDTRICTGNTSLQSNHLLTAVAAQNYGSNSYRIRQPFDFAGRTGTVVVDVDASQLGLHGWVSIGITAEPVPSPSFSAIPGAGNLEGGVIPKDGVLLELLASCGLPGQARVGMIHEYRSYVDHAHEASANTACFSTSRDHLNHLELRLSQTRVELWATPFSADGLTFEAATLVASADLALNFTRGYVQLTVRNHASLKYSDETMDAWVARWDNVGFDGPVIDNTQEFEVPDSLVSAPGGTGVGYLLTDASAAVKASVTIRGVSGVSSATKAVLALNVLYLQNQFGDATFPTYALSYRLNGHAWRTYDLTAEEKSLLQSGVPLAGDLEGQPNSLISGAVGHVFEAPLSDLVDGDNVLEIATTGVLFHGYPSTLANVDLILTH